LNVLPQPTFDSTPIAPPAWRTEHCLGAEQRDAREHVRAVLEEVVRQREVAVIPDERRAQEGGVRVIAGVRDPEGGAEAPGPHTSEEHPVANIRSPYASIN
jgi:hypothetical protein